MNRARHRTAATWQQSLIAIALIAVTCFGSAAVHRHALVPAQATHELSLSVSISSADHLTNSSNEREHPCSACAREGLGPAPTVGQAAAPHTELVLLPASPSLAEQPGQGSNVCLRGPPSVLVAG